MKTRILNPWAVLCLLALCLGSLSLQAQDKLSTTTQMFLDELSGRVTYDLGTMRATARAQGLIPVDKGAIYKYDRLIAKPDTINGKVYISAFVRIADPSAISELEALGVEVQCQFKGGTLLTTLIPIDQIEAVAAIGKVSRVNVATMMHPLTNAAREETNVDDVLNLTADATTAGLSKKYDGTGVLLGVIDTGIDFQHIAFKDKNGSSRIKRAYVYNGSSAQEYSSITSSSPTTDDKTGDHGTHTCSTAGGSSVIVNGTTVTVTDNHASATYGGMAPGSDLYLAGINGLSNTYLSNAFDKIITYASNNNQPVVVSNSWGSQLGPHDGTGDFADIVSDYFNNDHPNRICLFASSNDAGKSKDNEGGGYHLHGTATSSNPLGAVLRSATYINTDAGYMYAGIIASAWARNTNVTKLGVKIYVLDASTGAIKTTQTMTSSGSVSGLSTYFSGTLSVYYDQVESDKTQILLYSQNGITSRGTSTTTQNGSTYYTSKYTLAVEFYPVSGASSAEIDVWGGSYGYFTNHLTTSGHTWTAGSDDMCVSDEATIPGAISIGAYASKKTWTDYNGTSHTDDDYTLGDIAYFSSYATATESPTGLQYPWITAPGARLAAGVNHYHTTSVDDYSYYGTEDLVVNNSSYPYGMMQGTSMATPTAAGIVALWLQVAKENDLTLTTEQIKTVMKESAIHDSYTDTGENHTHFGNGKIDALGGIHYILRNWCHNASITASPTSLTFSGEKGKSVQKTVTVTGTNLEGDITVTLSDDNGVYAIDKVTITNNNGSANATITVTYTPTAAGTHSGSIKLSSANAADVTVTLSGTAVEPVITATPQSLTFSCDAGETITQTFTVKGTNLQGEVSATLSGSNFFTIDKTSIAQSAATNGATITVTYTPTTAGTHSGSIKLSSANAADVTVTLNGTAAAVIPTITTSTSSLTFNAYTDDEPVTKNVTITGRHLTGNIIATLNDGNGIYTITPTTITPTQAVQGVTLTVTYDPTEVGTTSASITLTSDGAETVTIALSGTAQGPTITASKQSISFTGYATRTYTETVVVTGVHLEEDIIATVNSGNGIYSVSPTTIGKTGAANGVTLTVTYAPTEAGTTEATVTLTSRNASPLTINLSGTAMAATPTLMVSPQQLTFSGSTEHTITQTFTVTGRFINSDINLTLADENEVFSVTPATISSSDVDVDNGKSVTVTISFVTSTEGTFTGTVNISSEGAETQAVILNASASNGGTASDAYLDIAKYASIDKAGWSSSSVDNLYRYTEYDNDEVAWLTLPVYGAWSARSQQGWITSSASTNSTATWNASDTYLGSSTYFTTTTARAMGNGSSNNRTAETVEFYVTNATAVKLLGKNGSRTTSSSWSSSTYPTTLTVYECTENSGNLTASNTATSSQSNATNSASVNLVIDNLDATKIYKVVASQIRGYLYEIGFETPINKPTLKATPSDINLRANVGEQTSTTFTVKGKMLPGDVTLVLNDPNHVFTITPTVLTKAQAEAGTDVRVTFGADVDDSFTATVNLTSGILQAQVNLTGISSDGGTATDTYLDLAKYATIDNAGWSTSDVDLLYQYTEYEDDEVAWLTMPSYGVYKADGNQAWFDTYVTRTTVKSWGSTDIFPGSSAYFSSATSNVVYWSNTDSDPHKETFYVTNCTAVKVYADNRSTSNTSAHDWRPWLYVYECTLNADGSLSASTTAAQSVYGTSTGEGILSITDLDATKIYKVLWSCDYSYMYEIGFQTPLKQYSLAELVSSAKVGNNYRLINEDIEAVYISPDGKSLYCKDDNKYSVKSQPADGQYDYVQYVANLMSGDWDQSNWVALQKEDGSEWTSDELLQLANQTLQGVKGRWANRENPVLMVSTVPKGASQRDVTTLNVYVTCNFGQAEQVSPVNGKTYWFMTPKPMEVAQIKWAMWDGSKFVTPTHIGTSNQLDLSGAFSVGTNELGDLSFDPVEGDVYDFVGLVKRESSATSTMSSGMRSEAASQEYVVYPLSTLTKVGGVHDGIITELGSLRGEQPVEVGRYNLAGQRVPADYRGVVIVRLSDGTVRKQIQ